MLSTVRSRPRHAPASCAKSRITRRVLPSRRLSHIRQKSEFSLPCLGVYHWLRTQAPLTPARQGRSSYATFAYARLRHGALARARWRITRTRPLAPAYTARPSASGNLIASRQAHVIAPFPCARSSHMRRWPDLPLWRVSFRSPCARRPSIGSLRYLLARLSRLSRASIRR